MYPTLVEEMARFLHMHSFNAQARRRSDAASSMGVTLEQIRQHLLDCVPGLKTHGISRSTVHRLMLPPRRKTQAAKQYKGLVQARVPCKKNTATRAEHPDLHFTRAQVGYVNEMFQYFGGVQLSCDDKNKISVGTPAVSRYHAISKFFSTADAPNYEDHDFPYPKAKIIPSGYMVLRHKEDKGIGTTCLPRARSLSPVRTCRHSQRRRTRSVSPTRHELQPTSAQGTRFRRDAQGRLHVVYPWTGELYVYTRAMKFKSCSALAHANDLHSILLKEAVQKGKGAVSIVCDNGPDWSMKSLHTVFAMGRLWRDLGLDLLIICSFAAGHSAQNMVEHALSLLSRLLVGVTFPITLEGESKPPA